MNNVIEMVPSIALDEAQREEVLACGRRIRTEKIALRKSSMAIGRDGAFIENLADRGSWEVFGCRNQHEFRIAEGIGRSNWYRVIGIGLKFLEVDRESYIAMSLENAERLAAEPPEVRHDKDNLQKAAEMTAEAFDDYMTTLGAHREGRPKREQWVQVKWRMRAEQRKVIQSALETWKQEHGIEDDAFALETLVMEYSDRPTLTGFILESIPRLTGTVRETNDIETLKASLVEYVQEMANIVRVCCGEVEEEEIA